MRLEEQVEEYQPNDLKDCEYLEAFMLHEFAWEKYG